MEGSNTDNQGRDGHGCAVLWGNGVAFCHEEDEGSAHGDVTHEEEEEGNEFKSVITNIVAEEQGKSICANLVDVNGRHGSCKRKGHGGDQKQARGL